MTLSTFLKKLIIIIIIIRNEFLIDGASCVSWLNMSVEVSQQNLEDERCRSVFVLMCPLRETVY